MQRLPLLLAVLLLPLLAIPARADTLVLENGDKLTGQLIAEENGVIQFQSIALGLIVLPVAKAHVEVSPKLAAVPANAPLLPPTEFKPVDLRAALRDPSRALRARPVGWQRRIEFGLTSQSSVADQTDIALRLEAIRAGRTSETRLLARLLYGENDDVRTTDKTEASARYRKNLSSVLFAQSDTRYMRDTVTGVDAEAEQGFGLGRNFVNRESLVLAFGGGMAARYREIADEPSGVAYVVDAFQDLTYAINSHFSLSEDMSLRVAPANVDDYQLHLNAAFTGKLTETLNLSMRYEVNYDRSLEDDARSTQRIVTALGYVF